MVGTRFSSWSVMCWEERSFFVSGTGLGFWVVLLVCMESIRMVWVFIIEQEQA